MEAADTTIEIRHQQGYQAYTLGNQDLEITVVPELGAKITSLKNLQTRREWMWHPDGGLKLFRNRLGDDFSRSTLVGADECLPTIAPCLWRGRNLPDHGEAWSAAWNVDAAAWGEGVLKTSVKLPLSPLEFERTLELDEKSVRVSYRLTSQSPVPERYLWALHPLLRVQPGDRLTLPATTRALLNGETWVDAVGTQIPAGGCSKAFAAPVREGVAGLVNERSGDCLWFEWNPAENNTLGLWLTRGGWHGHHHLAVEPTNGAPDPLTEAAAQKRCGMIPPFGSASWSLVLKVGP